jgi:DNA-binding NtrC family response regulator
MGNEPKAQILIVDDEPALLLSSCMILQRSGFEVSTANNSSEARRLLQQRPFDLVLSDLGLEEPLAGLDLLRWCRAQFPEMACILLTGSSGDSLEEEVSGQGIQVLFKPVQIPQLLESIHRLLGRA